MGEDKTTIFNYFYILSFVNKKFVEFVGKQIFYVNTYIM